MHYSGFELVILFFSYSFLGWLIETSVATIKDKRYRNRGFVSGPFCFIYGFSGVFMTIFLWELKTSPFYLFLGAAIVATVIEWFTGKIFERINQEKWWDYSNKKWNLDGYICLQYSLLWGLLGCVAMYWLNGLLLSMFHLLPQFILYIIVWGLSGISLFDVFASIVTVFHKEGQTSRLLHWNRKLEAWTTRFGHAVTSHIQKRIEKAYPEVHATVKTKKPEGNISFSEFFWLFILGAFLGDIVETLFCRLTAGVWMSRSSLVWGPFSVVWGLAMACVTALLYKSRDKSDSYLFVTGTILGGTYEYVCSVFTEIVFGKVFWDYSDIPFNLGGRINLLYCFFWGIAAVVWFRVLYPRLNVVIQWILRKSGKWLTIILVLFMLADVCVSVMALVRYDAREQGIVAEKSWEKTIDEHFPDARMVRIYPNAE